MILISKIHDYFHIEMYLSPGLHEYKFILDHEWVCDYNKEIND